MKLFQRLGYFTILSDVTAGLNELSERRFVNQNRGRRWNRIWNRR